MVGRLSSGGVRRLGLRLRVLLLAVLQHGGLRVVLRRLRMVPGLATWSGPTTAAWPLQVVRGRLLRRLLYGLLW